MTLVKKICVLNKNSQKTLHTPIILHRTYPKRKEKILHKNEKLSNEILSRKEHMPCVTRNGLIVSSNST